MLVSIGIRNKRRRKTRQTARNMIQFHNSSVYYNAGLLLLAFSFWRRLLQFFLLIPTKKWANQSTFDWLVSTNNRLVRGRGGFCCWENDCLLPTRAHWGNQSRFGVRLGTHFNNWIGRRELENRCGMIRSFRQETATVDKARLGDKENCKGGFYSKVL